MIGIAVLARSRDPAKRPPRVRRSLRAEAAASRHWRWRGKGIATPEQPREQKRSWRARTRTPGLGGDRARAPSSLDRQPEQARARSCVGTHRTDDRRDPDHRAVASPRGAVISSAPARALLRFVPSESLGGDDYVRSGDCFVGQPTHSIKPAWIRSVCRSHRRSGTAGDRAQPSVVEIALSSNGWAGRPATLALTASGSEVVLLQSVTDEHLSPQGLAGRSPSTERPGSRAAHGPAMS